MRFDIIKDITDVVLNNTEINIIGNKENKEYDYSINMIEIEREIVKILKEK